MLGFHVNAVGEKGAAGLITPGPRCSADRGCAGPTFHDGIPLGRRRNAAPLESGTHCGSVGRPRTERQRFSRINENRNKRVRKAYAYGNVSSFRFSRTGVKETGDREGETERSGRTRPVEYRSVLTIIISRRLVNFAVEL